VIIFIFNQFVFNALYRWELLMRVGTLFGLKNKKCLKLIKKN
jgi:hypothetical protein